MQHENVSKMCVGPLINAFLKTLWMSGAHETPKTCLHMSGMASAPARVGGGLSSTTPRGVRPAITTVVFYNDNALNIRPPPYG
jgi:hypothetical protein